MRPVLTILVALLVTQALSAQEQDLGSSVRAIFDQRCGACHGPDLRKPKGKFGFVTDLDRVREVYIADAEPGYSDLWLSITDPYEPMPPTKSKTGPLLPEEKAKIESWIAAGAPAPTAAPAAISSDAGAESQDTIPLPSSEPELETDGGNAFLADLHPLLVHFPIALVIVAALAELLIWRFGSNHVESVRLMLGIGFLGAFAACLTGWSAADAEGYREAVVFNHRWLGVAAMGASAMAFFLIEFGRRREVPAALLSGRILLLAAALLVGLTGHEGGELVHG